MRNPAVSLHFLRVSLLCLSILLLPTASAFQAAPYYDYFQRPQVLNGVTGNWDVVLGTAGIRSGAPNWMAAYDSFPAVAAYRSAVGAEQFSQAAVVSNGGPAVRINGQGPAAAYYACYGGSDEQTTRLVRCQGGSCQVLSQIAAGVANLDQVRLSASGSKLSCTVFRGSTSEVRHTLEASDGTLAEGRVGLFLNRSYGRGAAKWIGGELPAAAGPFTPASADLYVSAEASVMGSGSMENPARLDVVLDDWRNWLQPNTTIWVRGGTYDPPADHTLRNWSVAMSGTAESPLMLRAFPYEAPVLRAPCNNIGILDLSGSYITVAGLTLTTYPTCHVTDRAGSNPGLIPGTGVTSSSGQFQTVIANTIFNAGNGIFVGGNTGNTNFLSYGNLLLTNGWDGPDRGHGHNYYTRNYGENAGSLTHTKDILLDSFDFNIQHYGQPTYNLEHTDSIVCCTHGHAVTQTMNSIWRSNVFQALASVQGQKSLEMTGNVLLGGLTMNVASEYASFNNNLSVIPVSGVAWALKVQDRWGSILSSDNNTFLASGAERRMVYDPPHFYNLTQWQEMTGWDKASTLVAETAPKKNVVRYIPVDYAEPGRCHIAVVNFEAAGNQELDLSSCANLVAGAKTEIFDVQSLSRGPIYAGQYDPGSPVVTVPLLRDGDSAGIRTENCWNRSCQACVEERGWQVGTEAPAGSCEAGAIFWKNDVNRMYYCDAGKWVDSKVACNTHRVDLTPSSLLRPMLVRQGPPPSETMVVSWEGDLRSQVRVGMRRGDGTVNWFMAPTDVVCRNGVCTGTVPRFQQETLIRVGKAVVTLPKGPRGGGSAARPVVLTVPGR